MNNDQIQLDPEVVNLAKATRTIESGNNPTAQGKSGEYGYYQYEPDTWAQQSKFAGVDVPLKQATPQQQNQVWYTWAKAKKDAGNNIGQIASMQNAGDGEPNAYTGNFSDGSPSVGTNNYNVKFDVPTYAKSIANEYQKIKQTSSQSNGFVTQATLPQSTDQPSQNTGPVGTNPTDSTYGKLLNNNVTKGIIGAGNFLTGGGASQLGNELGSSLATIGEKTKGLLGGQDNSQYVPQADIGNTSAGLAKTVAGVGLLGGGGLLEDGIKSLQSTKLLSTPAMSSALENIGLDAKTFSTLSNGQKVDALTGSLDNLSVAEKKVVQQNIDKLLPQAIKEAGGKVAFSELYPKASKILKVASGITKLGLSAALGSELGNAYNKGQSIVSGLLK